MTANEVYEKALTLVNDIEDSGEYITEGTIGAAPGLIDMFQREVSIYDDSVPNKITSLDDELSVTDKGADMVVYKLAMQFALNARNADLFNTLEQTFYRLVRSHSRDEEQIQDVYGGWYGF